MPSATDLQNTLFDWSEHGWLRRLDSALAAFLLAHEPSASAPLLLLAAMLTHMEGRGHTCLPLAPIVREPLQILNWPPAAHAAVHALWASLAADLQLWLEALGSSRLVRDVSTNPAAPDLGQPLVLAGPPAEPLLYLRRYWVYEEQVAHGLMAAAATALPVNTAQARAWLNQLFDSQAAQSDVDWQKMACALALRRRVTIITGGPGTGKTYTAARLLALLLALAPSPDRFKVALAAPTGKAAARLRQAIEQSLQGAIGLAALAPHIGAAQTLHALLGARLGTRQFQANAAHPLDVDVLIVDETSMVHLELMAAVLQALPAQARLILLGDKDQLASVEAGAVLGDLCAQADSTDYDADTRKYIRASCGETLPRGTTAVTTALAQQTLMLRSSRRFGGAIGQLAQAVNAGDAVSAQQLLSDDDTAPVWQARAAQASPEAIVQLALRARATGVASYADYLQRIRAKPALPDATAHRNWVIDVLRAFDRFRILCAVHDGPWGDHAINHSVQQALEHAGLLRLSGEWYVGRPVMVTRNDAALGIFNGDVGVVLPPADGATLRAYFLDGDTLRTVAVSRLAYVETAFAMTVHKSQGSEFAHTVLALPAHAPEMLTRELVYTGITRARSHFSLVAGSPYAFATAITRRVVRASGLRTKLLDADIPGA